MELTYDVQICADVSFSANTSRFGQPSSSIISISTTSQVRRPTPTLQPADKLTTTAHVSRIPVRTSREVSRRLRNSIVASCYPTRRLTDTYPRSGNTEAIQACSSRNKLNAAASPSEVIQAIDPSPPRNVPVNPACPSNGTVATVMKPSHGSNQFRGEIKHSWPTITPQKKQGDGDIRAKTEKLDLQSTRITTASRAAGHLGLETPGSRESCQSIKVPALANVYVTTDSKPTLLDNFEPLQDDKTSLTPVGICDSDNVVQRVASTDASVQIDDAVEVVDTGRGGISTVREIELETRLREAQSANELLKRSLQSIDERCEATTSENAKLKAEIVELQLKYTTRDKELEEEVEHSGKQSLWYDSELDILNKTEVAPRAAKIDALDKTLQERDTEIRKLKEDLRAMNAKLSRCRSDGKSVQNNTCRVVTAIAQRMNEFFHLSLASLVALAQYQQELSSHRAIISKHERQCFGRDIEYLVLLEEKNEIEDRAKQSAEMNKHQAYEAQTWEYRAHSAGMEVIEKICEVQESRLLVEHLEEMNKRWENETQGWINMGIFAYIMGAESISALQASHLEIQHLEEELQASQETVSLLLDLIHQLHPESYPSQTTDELQAAQGDDLPPPEMSNLHGPTIQPPIAGAITRSTEMIQFNEREPLPRAPLTLLPLLPLLEQPAPGGIGLFSDSPPNRLTITPPNSEPGILGAPPTMPQSPPPSISLSSAVPGSPSAISSTRSRPPSFPPRPDLCFIRTIGDSQRWGNHRAYDIRYHYTNDFLDVLDYGEIHLGSTLYFDQYQGHSSD